MRSGGRGRQQNWKLFNDVIIAEGKCVYTQWPSGRRRASERPLVSVTGPAGFLYLPPRTDRKTQTRQSGAGLVNDAHGIFQEGGAPPRDLPRLSADLRPSYTQIIQQLLLIMPLSRNYVLAPLLSSAASVRPLGRPVLLVRPFPPRLAISSSLI